MIILNKALDGKAPRSIHPSEKLVTLPGGRYLRHPSPFCVWFGGDFLVLFKLSSCGQYPPRHTRGWQRAPWGICLLHPLLTLLSPWHQPLQAMRALWFSGPPWWVSLLPFWFQCPTSSSAGSSELWTSISISAKTSNKGFAKIDLQIFPRERPP